ncbi:divergent polysaccharide deacetylase family protein [Methylobacterium nonmethylotrophicum]|uniref:Divergent polysaccharide deacetylase family protein n=1 Tax=Methylobacterium nonmethylotrophicum TaxID=1141884 RepID=A0A4Z0NM47_9HYPH|nr:divergent polysaccharide deacetylase family protein [Methylobacterium nonmethylotrophicum]TGD96946.1 divergent polysaccharide deacetylase family protein [Methylobacterium nonmethylotrophicum]
MPLASDTILTRPLGLRDEAKARAVRWRAALRPRVLAAAGLGAGIVALAAFLVLADDPLAGEPHAVAPIEVRAPITPPPEPAPAPRPDPASRSAGEVERASGVAVNRPDGTGAPNSVVIRVPGSGPVQLAPAPDPRLAERGRYGVLPKVGPDGARPLDVYARPEAAGLERGGAVAGRIALVVSGLGIGQAATQDAVQRLAPAITLAFAPYGADVARSAARAREAGHEVLVQAPMEPFDYPDNDPGPQTLLAGSKPAENLDRLAFVLARVPGAVGVMNFMGARLTGEAAALEPVLREIGARGLGFLDDGTSPRSLAREVGRKAKAPVARAEIVVDAVPRPDAIDRELARLEEAARKSGFALGSATALPLSIDRIARWSRDLESRGILLVPASRALRAAP